MPIVFFSFFPVLYFGVIQRIIYLIKKIKYKQKINASLSLSFIRSRLIELFTQNKNNEEILKGLKELFVRNVTPIRPDRKFERKPDKYRQRTKPKHFQNRRTVL